jgi:hypothetical protein
MPQSDGQQKHGKSRGFHSIRNSDGNMPIKTKPLMTQ